MRSFSLIVPLFATLFVLTDSNNCTTTPDKASFKIDFENNQFLLDEKPYRYIAGSIHYFRVPPLYWQDRLLKIRAAGLNAIQFYVPWNFHEPFAEQYRFSGYANLTRFLDIAQEVGLKVLLRVGPYVCGEWENGGLPWWLLNIGSGDIRMRTADKRFMTAVSRWYSVLMPKIVPYLHKNGGPILMVQVENECGSFAQCRLSYTAPLRDMIRRYLGNDVVLYTTDGAGLSYLHHGYIPDVYPTVDFGTASKWRVFLYFSTQRFYAPRGPLVNSEFYPGWLVLWGQTKQDTVENVPSTKEIVETAKFMYALNASFNFYMFHGGTNFGFWNGAEINSPVITSYDYSAPISEAGDLTPKYHAIRNFTRSLVDWPHKPAALPPSDSRKGSYGPINMYLLGDIIGLAKFIEQKCQKSKYPLTFEQLNHPFGFVIYQTRLKFSGTNFTAPGLKDHGHIMINGVYQGRIIHNMGNLTARWINVRAKIGSLLTVIVENRGRQTYETINDYKGLTTNVSLDGQNVTDWRQCGLNIEKIFQLIKRTKRSSHHFRSLTPNNASHNTNNNNYNNNNNSSIDSKTTQQFIPSVFVGKFRVENEKCRHDTFLDSTGWAKGQFLINRFNVGRYWPALGPQYTLYTPKTLLKQNNVVVMFELEKPNCQHSLSGERCFVQFLNRPIL